MSVPRLAIPLYESATSKRWGKFIYRVCLLITVCVIGFSLDRAWHYRSTNTVWPSTAEIAIRLIKTPELNKTINQVFADVQALPGTPWSLTEAYSWSRREFVLYTDSKDVIGLKVDGYVPEQTLLSLSDWGWKYKNINHQQTLIYKANLDNATSTIKSPTTWWLLWPNFHGAISIKTPDRIRSVPIKFTNSHALDILADVNPFIPEGNLDLGDDTQLVGSLALPADWQSVLLPAVIPETFPGLQTLQTAMQNKPLDVMIGKDQQGLTFILAMPSPQFSLEELGAIATEGAGIQDLSTTELPINENETALEIRTQNEVTVNLSNNFALLVANAKTAEGKIFRLTQSSDQLIISNREPYIGLDSAKYPDTCLANPRGFIAPQALVFTPEMQSEASINTLQGASLSTKLERAKQFAYRKHRLRICW
jgi:hypothetical protein